MNLEQIKREVERIEGRTEWWDTRAIAEGRDVLGGGDQDLAVMKSDDAQRLISTIRDLVETQQEKIVPVLVDVYEDFHCIHERETNCYCEEDPAFDLCSYCRVCELLAELKGQDDGAEADGRSSKRIS